jgi:hypothetical protein
MSERKVVRRNIAIALGIICILLIAVIASFSITGISAQNSYNNLQKQNKQLQSWLDDNKTLLNQTQTWLDGNITNHNNYVNDHHNTDEEYNSLSSQIADLQAPKLIEVNLKAEDNRPAQQQTYLHVYGYVCNVGTDTAYNAILYVEAFQGVVLTFNTTISLGTINGGNYTSVDSQVVYPGYALTAWQVWSSPTGINHSWGS